MLDYLNGNISNRLVNQSFSELYERYVHLFDQALSDNPYLKKKYQAGGKASKYNYYLKETEVFARLLHYYKVRHNFLRHYHFLCTFFARLFMFHPPFHIVHITKIKHSLLREAVLFLCYPQNND